MKVINIVSDIDYFDDYNYAIDFNSMLIYDTPLIIPSANDNYSTNDIIKKIKLTLDNIPKLKYSVEDKLIKIKYFKKCNTKLIDCVKNSVLSSTNNIAYSSSDILVTTARNGILTIHDAIKKNSEVYFSLQPPKFKTILEYKDNENIFIQIKNLDKKFAIPFKLFKAFKNKIYLNYTLDNDYWSFIKLNNKLETKKSVEEELTKKIEINNIKIKNIENKLINLQAKTNLQELEKIQISDLMNLNEIETRGFTDGVKYVYNYVKKIFTFLNDNNDEIKQMLVSLQNAILELKKMYEEMKAIQDKLTEKQEEIYEKSLSSSERKKLEIERKKKEEEEKKREEEAKIKIEETKQAIDLIQSLSAFCGADLENNQDMKNVLNIYNDISKINEGNEKKEEKEGEEKKE